MKNAYGILLGAVVVAAIGLTLAGKRTASEPHAESVETARPITKVALVIEGGALVPARAAVQKGTDVHVSVTNRETHEVRVELAGYTDQISFVVEPGATWEGAFHADRPGEDFVWLIDGTPTGRFEVTGSHLVEGHR